MYQQRRRYKNSGKAEERKDGEKRRVIARQKFIDKEEGHQSSRTEEVETYCEEKEETK